MSFSIEDIREAVLSDLGIEDDEPGFTLDIEPRGLHTWSWEYTDGSGTHDWGLVLWRNAIGEFEFTIAEGSSSYDSADYEPTWEQNDAEWRAEQAHGE